VGTLTQWLTFIVLAATALGAIIWAGRGAVNFIERWNQFLDDWNGEPERPGISQARPGVLKRLTRLEESQAAVETAVKPNAGHSIKDQITRIEEHVVPPENRPS